MDQPSGNVAETTTDTPLFDAVFRETVTRLEADAKAVGLNFTKLCKTAKVSRSTPGRWRGKRVPKTISLISEMQRIVEAERQKLARG